MVVSSVLRTKTKTASVINTERPQGQAQVFRVPGPERRVLVAGAHGVLRAEGMGKPGELPPFPCWRRSIDGLSGAVGRQTGCDVFAPSSYLTCSCLPPTAILNVRIIVDGRGSPLDSLGFAFALTTGSGPFFFGAAGLSGLTLEATLFTSGS
jgi:hypothetical protein